MSGRSVSPLKVRENEIACPEEKEEASFPLSTDQKMRPVTKPKAIRASKNNLSDGNQAQKRALKYPRGLGEESSQPEGHPGGCSGALRRGVGGEPTLPLHRKENIPGSRAGPLGTDFHCTPEGDRAEGKPDFGAAEEQKAKPVDFATVTIADFGIAPGSFTKALKGNSPTLLKLRRRSTIGLRSSPENKSLILYLAQQRSSRHKAPLAEISPFKPENVRPLKDKLKAFQTCFESLQEAEEKTELSGLSQVDDVHDASQEGGSCKWIKYSVSRCDHSSADTTSDVLADPSRRKAGFVTEQSLAMSAESQAFVTPPVTPRQTGNIPVSGLTQSGSLRSILKKTPQKGLMDSPKEYLSGAADRGGGESLPVSYCEKALEASETESTDSVPSKTPKKKKKVSFGGVLRPEIFDDSLPANTPVHRGSFPRLPVGWHEECAEPLEELLEEKTNPAAEDLSPAENAEAQTDKPDVVQTHFPTKRKTRAQAQEGDGSSWGAPSSGNAAGDTQNPRRSKTQGKATAAPKRTQKTRRTVSGRIRKRKVEISLYGEREMASKKPLLSPIPEIPEVFSFVSSSDPPKADPLFSVLDNPKSRSACQGVQEKAVVEGVRGKDIPAVAVCPSWELLAMAAPGSSRAGTLQEDLSTSEYFQQGKGSACENEAKERSSWIENEQLQENPLTGLEVLEEQAKKDVQEGAQGAQCPQRDSVQGNPARRRSSSSAIYFPPLENLEITGIDLLVSSYNVEEVLSVPKDSSSGRRTRRSRHTSGEVLVRRSMRLNKVASEGLAWVQLPEKSPEPCSAPKSRRRSSTSILTGSENIYPREQNPTLFAAQGKENEDSAHLADGPCRRCRRQNAATPQKTPESQTKKRRRTSSVNKKDRNNQKQPEEAEMPPEVAPGDVSAHSVFLK